MAHEMWSEQRHARALRRPALTPRISSNSPQSLSRRRVPILIGGEASERRCASWPSTPMPAVLHGRDPQVVWDKLAVLREHCDRPGRPYEEIERRC